MHLGDDRRLFRPGEDEGVAAVLRAGPSPISEGCQEYATVAKPAAKTRKERFLIRKGHVDERIEGHDRVERLGWWLPINHVGLDEGGAGDEPAGSIDLHCREVDPGDLKARLHQLPGGGQSAAATKIENTRTRRERSGEFLGPRTVIRGRLTCQRIVRARCVGVGSGNLVMGWTTRAS